MTLSSFDGDLFGEGLLGVAGALAGPAEDVTFEGDLEAAACHGAGSGWSCGVDGRREGIH